MEKTNILERLTQQVDTLIAGLQEARSENVRLVDELNACRTHTQELDERIGSMQDQIGYKDMELEDLAVRIEQVLNGFTSRPDGAESRTEQPEPATVEG